MKLVSIIIPTLDSALYLNRTLTSIKDQTYKDIEVIVVDGGSKDNTLDIAKEFGVQIVKTTRGRSHQKNHGAKQSKGKYIYFVDSDFVLDLHLVESAVITSEKSGYDMIAVHNTSDASVSFWAKIRKFERDMLKGDKYTISPRFLTKEAFDSVNGFDENIVAGEDYEIYNRLNVHKYSLGFINEEEKHLGEPLNLKDIIKKHYYYGQTMVLGEGKTNYNKQIASKLTFWQKIPVKPAYIKNWYKFILHPFLTIGFLYYQSIRYIAGGIGWLSGRLSSHKF